MQDTQSAVGAGDPVSSAYALISARVDDTNVFDDGGRKLGTLHAIHFDAPSGRIEYAVLSIGGFLGLGQGFHPVPFRTLIFDGKLGGYIVALSKAVLDGGPSYRPDNAPTWDAAYVRRLSDYFASV